MGTAAFMTVPKLQGKIYEKIIIAASAVSMVFGSGASVLFSILPAEYDTLRWSFDFRRRRSTLGKLQYVNIAG
jgi:hypothetical protein